MTSAGVPQALRAGSAVAAFAYPESAARALGRVAERAEWLRRPLGSVPSLERIDRAAAALVVERALERSEDSWLDPAETRELLAAYGLPLVPERIARGRRRGGTGGRRARLSGRRQVRRRRRAQDRVRRRRARPRGRGGRARGRRADRLPRDRAADAARRHRAAGRTRPGSGLRPARRLRAGRRLRRADRRSQPADRAADRLRRRGARHLGQGRPARRAASAAPSPPTRPRSSTSSTGWQRSGTTCLRSPSSTSTRCSASPTAPSRSTPASASAGRCCSGARRAGSGSRSFPQRARRPPGCGHEARPRRFERQQPKEE